MSGIHLLLKFDSTGVVVYFIVQHWGASATTRKNKRNTTKNWKKISTSKNWATPGK